VVVVVAASLTAIIAAATAPGGGCGAAHLAGLMAGTAVLAPLEQILAAAGTTAGFNTLDTTAQWQRRTAHVPPG
jgi:hypothetical protein